MICWSLEELLILRLVATSAAVLNSAWNYYQTPPPLRAQLNKSETGSGFPVVTLLSTTVGQPPRFFTVKLVTPSHDDGRYVPFCSVLCSLPYVQYSCPEIVTMVRQKKENTYNAWTRIYYCFLFSSILFSFKIYFVKQLINSWLFRVVGMLLTFELVINLHNIFIPIILNHKLPSMIVIP